MKDLFNFGALQSEQKRDSEVLRLQMAAEQLIQKERALWLQAGLKPGHRVLDLGCGPGFTARALAQAVGPDGFVLGVDHNRDFIHSAEQQAREVGPAQLHFKFHDIYQRALPDQQPFDFIYSRMVFHNLEKPVEALRNAFPLLRRGGSLAILDIDWSWLSLFPESEELNQIFDQVIEYKKSNGGDPFVGRKLYYYFREAGFVDVQVGIHPVTSQLLGIDQFLKIWVGPTFELAGVSERAREALVPILENRLAWAAAGVFFASGRVPE